MLLLRHLHFMRNERDELYGAVDIIRSNKDHSRHVHYSIISFSNIGGLLGLCMGFSMLSAVELIYFLLKYCIDIITFKNK